MISVEVTGLDEWIGAFNGAPRIIEEEMEDTVDSVLGLMIGELATYPPERPNQHYERTFKLRDGWKNTDRRFVFRGGNLAARITSPVPYAEDVQGDEQGPLFVGRWRKASDIEKQYAVAADAAFEQARERAERRIEQLGN